mgnify:CR=1 FL=1
MIEYLKLINNNEGDPKDCGGDSSQWNLLLKNLNIHIDPFYFGDYIKNLILSGQLKKLILFEDLKGASLDDEIVLCDKNDTEFAKIKIIWIKEIDELNLNEEEKWIKKLLLNDEIYKKGV